MSPCEKGLSLARLGRIRKSSRGGIPNPALPLNRASWGFSAGPFHKGNGPTCRLGGFLRLGGPLACLKEDQPCVMVWTVDTRKQQATCPMEGYHLSAGRDPEGEVYSMNLPVTGGLPLNAPSCLGPDSLSLGQAPPVLISKSTLQFFLAYR